jgi:hypothetical protein
MLYQCHGNLYETFDKVVNEEKILSILPSAEDGYFLRYLSLS